MQGRGAPSHRRPTGQSRLAVLLAVLAAACWISVLAVLGTTPVEALGRISSIGIGEGAGFAVAWTAFPIVGAVIIQRRPGNAIGWLCVIGGLQVGLFALLTGFATRSLATEPASFAGVASAWLSHALVPTLLVFPLLIMMRFPTGQSLGPGWRRAEQASLILIAALVVGLAFEPMPLFSFPTTPNPLALGSPRITALGPGFFVVLWLSPIASSIGALVIRYRRGSALERVQVRWLAAASVVVGAAALSMPLTSPDLTQGRMSTASSVAFALGFSTIPVTIGIAIVRHQLYDIDRIVKRTLVYALVSAVLGVIYVVAVLALSTPLHALSPAAGNTLVTAGSTLLVASLFRPVRARAQEAINRRFDRERYEAARMTESFAGQLRTEVGLDGIVSDLVVVTGMTVHPSALGCWIRGQVRGAEALVGSPGRS